MFYGITDVYLFTLGSILIVLAPGPNSLYVLSLALASDKKKAYYGALGIVCGDSILILLTAIGATSLFTLYPSLFLTIQIVGGLYLAYLGVNLILLGVKSYRGIIKKEVELDIDLSKKKNRGSFRKALFISLLNPKAYFFLFSFFIQFVDPSYPNKAVPLFLLALILQSCSLIYLTSMILSANRVSKFFSKRTKLQGVFYCIVGLVFIYFAINLVPHHLNF